MKEVILLVEKDTRATRKFDSKKCVHCNMDIRASSKFCSFCGKPAEENPVSEVMEISEDTEEKVENFAFAIEKAFDVEISEDTEAYAEELFDEEDFEESLSDWEEEELEDYETFELRELMEVGKGVCRGTLPDEELEELLDYLKEKLQENLDSFIEIKEIYKRDSFIVREILVRIERAFNLYEDGIDEIDKYFLDGDSDNILEGLDIARAAVNRLHKSFLLLNDEYFNDEENDGEEDFLDEEIKKMDMAWKEKVTSMMSEDEEYLDISDEEEEYYTNPNFERLELEVEMFKEGKINEERFSSFLTWMDGNLESGKKDFKDLSSPSCEEGHSLERVIIAALDAFRMYEKGLMEMKKFFSDKNFLHIDNGLEMAFEATQIIAQLQLSFEDPEEIIFID
jgi:hypothetical protein